MKTSQRRFVVTFSFLVLSFAFVGPTRAENAHMGVAVHKGTYNYLRVAPNRNCHIIMKMRQGTEFQVVGFQDGYYAVILQDGTRGWTAAVNVRFIYQ